MDISFDTSPRVVCPLLRMIEGDEDDAAILVQSMAEFRFLEPLSPNISDAPPPPPISNNDNENNNNNSNNTGSENIFHVRRDVY